MRKMIAYLTTTKKTKNATLSFIAMHEHLFASEVTSRLLKLRYDHDEIDMDSFREFHMSELYKDITAFTHRSSVKFPDETFYGFFGELDPGVYHVSDVIREVILRNKNELKSHLRNHYYSLVGHDVIDTALGFIDADLNASKAAKTMYMHRNTLAYRLDRFADKTDIDIRSFRGAEAVHLLFKY